MWNYLDKFIIEIISACKFFHILHKNHHVRLFCFLILVSILFTSYKCEAHPDTTYLDSKWQKTEIDIADYYQITNFQQHHLYKVDVYYMKNNRLQMSGYFSHLDFNPDSNIKVGPFVYYDDKGNIQKEGSYENNKEIGEWKTYYPESKDLWYTEHYEEGKLSGDLISYYRSGKIKRRETHKLNDTTVTGFCFEENGMSKPFTKMMIMPKAGYSIIEFLMQNLVYPPKAIERNIEGRVLVEFVVEEDGTITKIEVLKSVYPDLDKEAKRLVAKMPKWIPGLKDDKPTKVSNTQPILFKLQ